MLIEKVSWITFGTKAALRLHAMAELLGKAGRHQGGPSQSSGTQQVHCMAVGCYMVLHQAFRARHYSKHGFGGEVLHGATSGVPR